MYPSISLPSALGLSSARHDHGGQFRGWRWSIMSRDIDWISRFSIDMCKSWHVSGPRRCAARHALCCALMDYFSGSWKSSDFIIGVVHNIQHSFCAERKACVHGGRSLRPTDENSDLGCSARENSSCKKYLKFGFWFLLVRRARSGHEAS